jgi:tRNA(fMet)-specific endonuclease VapC
MPGPSLLDTDILSEIRKGKNPVVAQRAFSYLNQYKRYTCSLITRFEVLRGLKARKATVQLVRFDAWCQVHDILPIRDEIIVLAADCYANLYQAGQLIGDADLLIAATALYHGLALVTGNVAHFSRIPGLVVEDWTKP